MRGTALGFPYGVLWFGLKAHPYVVRGLNFAVGAVGGVNAASKSSRAVYNPKNIANTRAFRNDLAMQAVRSNPKIGTQIMNGKINDPRYKPQDGWRKMQYVHQGLDGIKITVHYFYNIKSKKTSQVKIK